jgi:xanthine dehydrogenase YagT iron-sulfur-binding subunit
LRPVHYNLARLASRLLEPRREEFLMADDLSDRFNRRWFLKGSGAAAAASAMAAVPAAAVAQEDTGPEVISGETTITLNVNGTPREVEVEPRTTLLDVLRYQLDLTGAKPVSGDGSSGASTVLVDGKPVMASTTLALAARGKRIETVESLGGDSPDAVPRAFVAHDAQQCGFCTPGFVVAVRAFLNENPQASEEQIRESLGGNICRCGTYANVLGAVISLVKGR